jgi:hypothetical protein
LKLVPKSSAAVPGAVNAEAIPVNKDHIGMSKFESPEDEDFQTICGHLQIMVREAPNKMAERWSREKVQGV